MLRKNEKTPDPCGSPPLRKGVVVVGMSGGVDSSVAAYLLREQGYRVIGLFMKNWEETDDAGCCTATRDYDDVRRVCEALDIPYYAVNFARQYMDNVFRVFLDGLKRGITPNPDVLCNREIKFGPFLEHAQKLGADYIATGHYCSGGLGTLKKAADKSKDQTYFLSGVTKEQLSKVIFPLGDLQKTEVRAIAKKMGLVTHDKKDSTGICFIGERNFRAFMKTYLGNQAGDIKTLDGRVVGKHEGLMYYTIGQGKGLGIGGVRGADNGKWFVIKKDLSTNTLYVHNGDHPSLYSKVVTAHNFNWIVPPPEGPFKCTATTRYRQPDTPCTVEITPFHKGGAAQAAGVFVRATFDTPVKTAVAGQWLVLYNGDVCMGGGEIV